MLTSCFSKASKYKNKNKKTKKKYLDKGIKNTQEKNKKLK
jgi:hypothetical protein